MLYSASALNSQRRPHGKPRINTQHPVSQGLVFCGLPECDELAGAPGILPYAAATAANSYLGVFSGRRLRHEAFRSLYSNSETAGGWRWDILPGNRLYTITDQCSLMWFGLIDTLTAWSKFLHVPYYTSGSWANPYVAVELARNGNSTSAHFSYAINSSTNYGVASPELLIDTGVPILIGVSRYGTNVAYYKDGHPWGASVSITAGSCDFTNRAPVMQGQRFTPSTGEGVKGHFAIGAIWNRALSMGDWFRLGENPFCFLE